MWYHMKTQETLIRHRSCDNKRVFPTWGYIDSGVSAFASIITCLDNIFTLIQLSVPYTHSFPFVIIPNLRVIIHAYADLNVILAHIFHLKTDIRVRLTGHNVVQLTYVSSVLHLQIVLAIKHIIVGYGRHADAVAINSDSKPRLA